MKLIDGSAGGSRDLPRASYVPPFGQTISPAQPSQHVQPPVTPVTTVYACLYMYRRDGGRFRRPLCKDGRVRRFFTFCHYSSSDQIGRFQINACPRCQTTLDRWNVKTKPKNRRSR